MLDVKRLTLLREIALGGSLNAASRALGLSSSAISQQITRLERDTGVTLLEAAGRGVKLTPLALELVQHTEQVLERLEAAEASLIAGRNAMRDVVRIAGFSTFATEKLPGLIHLLAKSHPELTVEFLQLDPHEAMDELAARRADILLVDEYPAYPLHPRRGHIRTIVAREPIAAYLPAGHPGLDRAESLDALAALTWVMEPRSTDASLWAWNTCRILGFEPRVGYESPSLQLHLLLVEEGLAAAFLPTHMASASAMNLQQIRFFPQDLHRTVHSVIRRGSELRPGVRACLDKIKRAYRVDESETMRHDGHSKNLGAYAK